MRQIERCFTLEVWGCSSPTKQSLCQAGLGRAAPLRELKVIPYMQKTCDVAEKAILAKINLRKKCVNRDKMYIATKVRKS